jgi:prolyl-tRNA synthetase
MTHSDNKGLVLTPKLAPIQVVIVPIFKTAEQFSRISEKALNIKKELEKKGISVKFDDRDTLTPGWKFSEYEFKGVPIRLAIGPRDLENNTVEIARRDTLEKSVFQLTDIDSKISHMLEQIQQNLFQKAKNYTDDNTSYVKNWKEFNEVLEDKGGFIYAHWDGTPETEQKIKDETKATIRCIPLNNPKETGSCIFSGKISEQKVIFARAY